MNHSFDRYKIAGNKLEICLHIQLLVEQ